MSERGLYTKYIVFRNDHSVDPRTVGDPLGGCFVLRPEKDLAARSAILQYASMITDKKLQVELRAWIAGLDELGPKVPAAALPKPTRSG